MLGASLMRVVKIQMVTISAVERYTQVGSQIIVKRALTKVFQKMLMAVFV